MCYYIFICSLWRYLPELSKTICNYNENNDVYNFVSYKEYFKDFSSEYFSFRIIIIIIESVLYFCSNYYIYVIYQKLSPLYHICMKRFNYLIFGIINLILDLINNNIENIGISISILDIIILFFIYWGHWFI